VLSLVGQIARYPRDLALSEVNGIDVSYEIIRAWWNRFAPMFAASIKKSRFAAMRTNTPWRWYLDEAFVKINVDNDYL